MGNEICCESKRYVVDFNQCFDLKCISVVLGAELRRIHRISKKITFQHTLTDNYDHSLFRDRNPEDQGRFFYYLKLEMILNTIKHHVDENTMPERFANKLKIKNTISSKNLVNISKCLNKGNVENQQVFIERRNTKFLTTKTSPVKKVIKLQNCINFLTQIMDTEEHYNEEILKQLEGAIELRLYK
jgi:hypothetical protein